MKTVLPLLLFLLLSALATGQASGFSGALGGEAPDTGTLRLKVANIDDAAGMIWVGIYTGEDNFLIKEKARLVGAKVSRAGDLIIELEEMEFGREYSLAIFHDVDNDGEMNRNWLGLPTEPWAFSGRAITRLRLPTFEETKFRMSEKLTNSTLRLRMI